MNVEFNFEMNVEFNFEFFILKLQLNYDSKRNNYWNHSNFISYLTSFKKKYLTE